MITNKIKFNFTWCLAASLLFVLSCERDISDDAVLASFPNVGEIFTDVPVGLGSDFYFPYDGSKPTAWSVDQEESYEGQASMRVDVPNANDPEGSYAGAILRIDGSPRNLTGFDALTFWAKASQGVTIGEFGFGEDFMENEFQTTITNISLSTAWQKIVIPIPDSSRLDQVLGMFRYAAGSQGTGGNAYTFWVDELQFEKLGTIAQPRPAIQNGNNTVAQTFTGGSLQVTGLTQTFNTTKGDVTASVSPSYFEFESSDESVATVDQDGIVQVIGLGTAVISATLGEDDAEGSLIVESLGNFSPAPTPTQNPENVISVFSDAYENVPVLYYNGFFTGDGQTTLGGTGQGGADIIVDGDGIINYTDLNFVGIGTFNEVSPIDATAMTHLHLDINVNEQMNSSDFLRIQLINSVGNNESSSSIILLANQLSSFQWESFDLPLNSFPGLTDTSQIGLLFFVSDGTISDIYVDNIYYYADE